MKTKFTRLERNWVLYDVGNSAFTMMVSTLIPIYFDTLAEAGGLSSADYLAYWGYAISISTLLVVFIGPVFGTITDNRGYKKPIFMASIIFGVICCFFLGLPKSWLMFLVLFAIARTAYSSSLVFYDSMLIDVTTEERMDRISSSGYAWGYIGSCIPFIACLVLVLKAGSLGLSSERAMAIAFVITGLWWLVSTIPLLRTYEQKNYVEKVEHPFSESFRRIGRTIMNARKEKKVFIFLLSFFFYIDGVYTIIDMATAYGKALGLNSTGLLLALLLTQFVAFPCAILFGVLSQKYNVEKLILVCILSYLGISIFAFFLAHQWQFWMLAVWVGMFQGGIQALSRSYFTKIVPSDQTGEFFGLYDICGKGAAILGTTIVSVVSQFTGSVNKGVGMISIMFVLGIFLFIKASKTPGRNSR